MDKDPYDPVALHRNTTVEEASAWVQDVKQRHQTGSVKYTDWEMDYVGRLERLLSAQRLPLGIQLVVLRVLWDRPSIATD